MKIFAFLFLFRALCFSQVQLGIDRFFTENFAEPLKGKKVALVTNQTGVDGKLRSTLEIFHEKATNFSLAAIFCPEHGLHGSGHAWEFIPHGKNEKGIPIFSLHGETRRPTDKMLSSIDLIIYDIQDIGSRAYTYITTLFYVMEEAAKRKIPVIVLDRPNPLGNIVDGPMLDLKWRSYIGYINVPYCHGMTIGELATLFNQEYKIGCQLTIIPMKGWERSMTFSQTGLTWVPTSAHIPEPDTPLFFASTGILGELGIVNIGVGFTMPFKVIGAPWIQAEKLASAMNQQKLPGVHFCPFHYKPFYGSYRNTECQGVLISITDAKIYKPLSVQSLLIGVIKSLYPKQFQEALSKVTKTQKDLFCKAIGSETPWQMLTSEKYIGWALVQYQQAEREAFEKTREKYLLY